MARINLGCGKDIRQGYVNCDIAPLPGVDKVFDLDSIPYPFADGEADEIVVSHVLEHLNSPLPEVMDELWRILKPGGRLHIRVPYYNSEGAWADPTHTRPFTYRTFGYFVKASHHSYYSKHGWSRCSIYLKPTKFGLFFPTQWLKRWASTVLGMVVSEIRVEMVK